MTSQPGLQIIAIRILPNISQSKDNQAMKFGQLIEYNKRNIFIQKIFEWETSSRPLFFCLKKRTSHEVKASGLNLDSIYTYSDSLNLAYNKNKLHETLDY